jgi:hypothetical protein
MKSQIYILVLFLSFIKLGNTQNKILFVGGDSLLVKNITLFDSTQEISFQLYNSGRTKFFNKDEIFSIIDNKTGKETILFEPFAEDSFNFTINNMRLFIHGEQYSDKHSEWFAGMLGLGIGFASPILMANKFNPFYSPLPVAIATAFIGSTAPSRNKIKRMYPKLANDPYFLEGYILNSKARRINSSLRGGIIGFVAGWITAIVLSNQPKPIKQ